MADWRWLAGDELNSADNMLLDEALLESLIAGESKQTVRVYRWPTPCVTLGRNQNIEEARGAYPYSAIYKRPTGGRAVKHGDDLIVTIVAKEGYLRDVDEKGGILASYHRILTGILDTIRSYGVEARTGFTRKSANSVDCFSSVGKCDVVDADTGIKIVGSAQFRSRGAILQQMSIRKHQRYHIEDAEFILSLKDNLARCLAVERWEVASSALPSEYSRCSIRLFAR